MKPRRIVLDSPAGSTSSSAPDLIDRVDRWTKSDRIGNLALPTIRMSKPGTYPIRINPTKGETAYLNLVAKKG